MKLLKHGIEINVERDDASNRERAVGGLGLVLGLGIHSFNHPHHLGTG